MIDRRTYLATAGTALTAVTAGCGFLLGNEPATFSASASAVPDSVLEETGYEHTETEEMEIEREFSAAGQTRTVVATNVLAKHGKTIDLGVLGEKEAAVFTALTTPQVKVLDKTFNPVNDMSAKELAKMVQDRYSGFENVDEQSSSEVTINDKTTQQVKFAGDAALSGSPVEIYLHVSEAVELGSDFLVTFGSYPMGNSDEEANILELMQSVQSA
jgi:hypothetical protein